MLSKLSILTRNNFAFIFAVSGLALLLAYSSEIFFGLKPCILCVYQRIPYFIIIIISSITFLNSRFKKIAFFLIVLSLIAEIILAGYHVGIERYIFEENHLCQNLNNDISIFNLASNCSQVQFRFMNFSMAEWNMFYAIFCLFYFNKLKPF